MTLTMIRITEKHYKEATHSSTKKGIRLHLDAIGCKKGTIRLLSLYKSTEISKYFYKVKCDCGRTSILRANNVLHQNQMFCSLSCKLKTKHVHAIRRYKGREECGTVYKRLKRQNKLPNNLTLNEARRLAKIWRGMLHRCGHVGSKPHRNYAARGIKVYKLWREDLWSFILYIGPRPSLIHSVDRINNDGNYEPGNVKWSTPSEQQRNRRNTK